MVVGDCVTVKEEGDNWMIVDLQERKNYIVRKSVNLSKQTHIIAANINHAILSGYHQKPSYYNRVLSIDF